MEKNSSTKDLITFFVCAVVMTAVTAAIWRYAPQSAPIVLPLLFAMVVSFLVLLSNRKQRIALKKIQQKQDQDFRQVEALFALYEALKPGRPLPRMRDWAGSPDLLAKVADVVLTEKPEFVVEASSGVSTLVIAYCLKQLGRGRVVALEHDEKFAAISQATLNAHGLSEVATVLYAPLVDTFIGSQQWQWYDLARLDAKEPSRRIDLLVIDGPPERIQKLSRYPAVPLLHHRLSSDATIILDDGYRPDEREAVDRWLREFPGLSARLLDLEKGAYLVHMGGSQ